MNRFSPSSIIILVLTIFISSLLSAQDTKPGKNHTLFLKTQFFQLKDEFNYGLAFSGINLVAGYAFTKLTDKTIFDYEAGVGFGANFNKGVGLAWRFKPMDIFYGHNLASIPLTVGGYFAADYQWQQYSELQGGHLFWFSSIELGPQIIYKLPFKSKLIQITFSNSLAGITSRPEPGTEAYFYKFNLSRFIQSAHEHLKFGSLGLFNHTLLKIGIQNSVQKRHSIAYAFEYFGYYQPPTLSFLNHSLNFYYKIGKL